MDGLWLWTWTLVGNLDNGLYQKFSGPVAHQSCDMDADLTANEDSWRTWSSTLVVNALLWSQRDGKASRARLALPAQFASKSGKETEGAGANRLAESGCASFWGYSPFLLLGGWEAKRTPAIFWGPLILRETSDYLLTQDLCGKHGKIRVATC